ncbi:MAG: hypothetical protein LCH69_02965 [Proteobacteria bacterium]|nr:hypothetical protein [Pseudomonadota bacterium]
MQDFMGFSPDPSDPLTYYATGHPEEGGNSGFLASRDGGQTWTQISQGPDGPIDFHAMDASPADPATIYGLFGGLQVNRDSGKTWAIAGVRRRASSRCRPGEDRRTSVMPQPGAVFT